MHDIHLPHEGGHNWKNYFTHISIIVIGLLIALGLDQTVEALHRRHQRTELRELLRNEGEEIARDADSTAVSMQYRQQWLAGRIEQVKVAVWQHQPLAAPAPFDPPASAYPDDPLWRSSKAAGLTPLLGEDENEAYSEVELLSTKVGEKFNKWRDAESACHQWEDQFPQIDGKPDFSKASTEDLREYLRLLNALSGDLRILRIWNMDTGVVVKIILGGDLNLQRIFAAEHEAGDRIDAEPHA